MEKKAISCWCNIDTAYMDVPCEDGSGLSICCPGVADMVTGNILERTERN